MLSAHGRRWARDAKAERVCQVRHGILDVVRCDPAAEEGERRRSGRSARALEGLDLVNLFGRRGVCGMVQIPG